MTFHRAFCVALFLIAGCATPPVDSPAAIDSVTGTKSSPDRPSTQPQLIVFKSDAGSTASDLFASRDLPAIQQLAAEENLEIQVRDVAAGAPAEIGIAPTIVFQNYRGRAIYQGRTSTIPRLRNFVRTARALGQDTAAMTREHCFVQTVGRATIALVVKVTPLNGSVPIGYTATRVQEEAREYLRRAFNNFEWTERVHLKRTDRTFYVDFYPHRSDTGALYISGAVFSQFNCHEPVFTTPNPTELTWDRREEAFQLTARRLEIAVASAIASGETGDGFDALDDATAVQSWDDLELPLPAKPAGSSTATIDRSVPRMWSLPARRENEPSRLLFHFGAPLDNYAGEAQSVESELQFSASRQYASLRGNARVNTVSVTMGDPDLDDSIRDSTTLDSKNHPESSFEITAVETEFEAPEFGVGHPIVLRGTFKMRGKATPLEARATLEPIIDEQGKPALLVEGTFRLRLLETFGIYGPDGPAPANDTLLFHFAFRYEPKTIAGP